MANSLKRKRTVKYKFPLGVKLRDRVSDFEGIAIARYEYLNGCIRYALGGKKEGDKLPEFVFDEAQLEEVQAEPVKVKAKDTGGPRDHTPVPR